MPVRGPTLKQLLAADEAERRAERRGAGRPHRGDAARARICSPPAAPRSTRRTTARSQRLTAALNKVPGRVLVVGHTDDQPIRSLRYQDNFELSRERAVSVVKLLQQGIDNSRQVDLDRRRLLAAALPSRVRSREPRAQPARRNHSRAWDLT